MSGALESSAHPNPEAIYAPPKPTRPARRRSIALLLLLFPLIQLLSFLGVFAPVFSPLVYANLAPPDWHNATPHGRIILTGFAVSVDEPGLIFACGWLETLGWPQPWSLGSTRYWRSTDGGAHWQLFQPPFQTFSLPFQDKQYCTLTVPPGGHGAVLATLSTSDDPSGPVTILDEPRCRRLLAPG